MYRENFILKELNMRNYKVGAEVGVAAAGFSSHILRYWKGTLYMVDVWRELSDDIYEDATNQSIEANVWLEAMMAIRGMENRALMMRMYSHQAANLIADNSLDFVYIDANHRYDAVVEDIKLWWPKVRSGGMLAGHDYLHGLDWTTPSATTGKDKHVYIKNGIPYTLETKVDSPEYAGLFGVYPAVQEFAKNVGYTVNHTDEPFSTWYLFK